MVYTKISHCPICGKESGAYTEQLTLQHVHTCFESYKAGEVPQNKPETTSRIVGLIIAVVAGAIVGLSTVWW